jgi:hypothetical protein
MRFGAGILILALTAVFAAWGAWKVYMPRKRQRGMRLGISPAKADDDQKGG